MDRPDASVWRERKRVFLNKEFCWAVLLSLAERGKTDNALDQQPNHLAQRLGSFWKKPLFKKLVKHVSFFGTFYSENCIFPPPLVFHDAPWSKGFQHKDPFLQQKNDFCWDYWLYLLSFPFPPGPRPPSPLPPAPPVWVGFVGCLVNGKKSNSPSYEHKTTSRTAVAAAGQCWSCLCGGREKIPALSV